MKFYSRAGIYKASNVTFNPTTKDAYSYSWWRFVGVVEGVLIFNDFNYSASTIKHQYKVRRLMESLGINPDLTLSLPRGIRHDQTLEELIVEGEEQLCNEFLHQEELKIRRAERRAEKRAAEFERIAAAMAEHAAKNHLTIVEQGVGEYTVSKGGNNE